MSQNKPVLRPKKFRQTQIVDGQFRVQINPRDWKHALMPTVPVDKWYKGRRFLAQHGNDLIVARS